ncbi:MAG: hypothetical protein ACE5JA_05575, partial [bacterium]
QGAWQHRPGDCPYFRIEAILVHGTTTAASTATGFSAKDDVLIAENKSAVRVLHSGPSPSGRWGQFLIDARTPKW